MHVTLDGKTIQAPDETLFGVLGAARAVAESAGRVIVEAKLDGEPIADALLASPGSSVISGGSVVEFVSAEPRALVSMTLHDVGDALMGVGERHRSAAEMLQVGQITEAAGVIGETLAVWEATARAVGEGPALLRLDLRDVPASIDGKPVDLDAAVGELLARLEDVRASMAAEDWAGLADTLAFDLAELADEWQKIVRSMAESIGKKPQ